MTQPNDVLDDEPTDHIAIPIDDWRHALQAFRALNRALQQGETEAIAHRREHRCAAPCGVSSIVHTLTWDLGNRLGLERRAEPRASDETPIPYTLADTRITDRAASVSRSDER